MVSKGEILSSGFLEYLINKYFVFHPLAELDESNTIDDISILQNFLTTRDVGSKTRLSDDSYMVDLCKGVIRDFRCYRIDNMITDATKLCEGDAEEIYASYKKYKCSSGSKTRETETSLHLDNALNTSKTFFVKSLDDLCTDDLIRVYGQPRKTGLPQDDFRYEYAFRFAKGGKVYTFSLYDYKNDEGEFYDMQDIFWHVGSTTSDREVVREFVGHLKKSL